MPTDAQSPTAYYSDEAATFGDRVCAAREALPMSQEDLAERLGVKFKTIKAWEEDLAEPRANKLQMLSGILNVSLRWLLTGEGQGVDAPLDSVSAPEDVAVLLAELRALRGEASHLGERLGRLEKRLRASLRT